VIPPEFDYVAPGVLDEAIALLSEGGEDAKLLAGGHSLLPLMKLRLAAPRCWSTCARCPGSTASSGRTGTSGSAP
jgi:carbon-monoxide dehydrogenase medium subunit